MICAKCKGQTKVINTVAKMDAVYRVRQCVNCGERFTTAEQVDNSEHVVQSLKDRWKQYAFN